MMKKVLFIRPDTREDGKIGGVNPVTIGWNI
jgi:hypothetical protein